MKGLGTWQNKRPSDYLFVCSRRSGTWCWSHFLLLRKRAFGTVGATSCRSTDSRYSRCSLETYHCLVISYHHSSTAQRRPSDDPETIGRSVVPDNETRKQMSSVCPCYHLLCGTHLHLRRAIFQWYGGVRACETRGQGRETDRSETFGTG